MSVCHRIIVIITVILTVTSVTVTVVGVATPGTTTTTLIDSHNLPQRQHTGHQQTATGAGGEGAESGLVLCYFSQALLAVGYRTGDGLGGETHTREAVGTHRAGGWGLSPPP